MTCRISLVVPAYNAQAYLEQCLSSIEAQTYGDFEAICVNDGSTDGSLALMRSFAAHDARFRVIDVANGGYGKAVNRGIDAAVGDYLGIVESDDYLDPRFCELLIAAADRHGGPDVVKAAYWRVVDADSADERLLPANYVGRVAQVDAPFVIAQDAELLRHHPSIWSAVYRRGFLEARGIRMKEEPGAAWVDNPWLMETLLQASSIVYLDECLYYYRESIAGSSTDMSDPSIISARWCDMDDVVRRLGVDAQGVIEAHYGRGCAYVQMLDDRFDAESPQVKAGIAAMLARIDEEVVKRAGSIYRGYRAAYFTHVPGFYEAPEVSVIVPMHNSAEYLGECLSSVVNQSFFSLELICVDDGSTDDTCEVVRTWAQGDPRVHLVTQENAGPGTARNRGLDVARGRYVYFLDSDDYVNPRFVERALDLACSTGADVVASPFVLRNEAAGVEYAPAWSLVREHYPEDGFTWRDNPDALFCTFHNYPWNKLVRKGLLDDSGVRFQEDVRLTEDLMYSAPVLVLAQGIACLDDPLVVHREGTGQNVMAHKDPYRFDFVKAFLALRGFLDEQGIFDELARAYYAWALSACRYNLTTLCSLDAFREVFYYLKERGFAELGIDALGPDDLDAPEDRDFLESVRTRSCDEYLFGLFKQVNGLHDAAVARYFAACERIGGLQGQLTGQQASAGRISNELSRTQAELSSVQAELSSVQAELSSVQAELARLEADHNAFMNAAEQKVGRALCALPRAVQRAVLERRSKAGSTSPDA